MGQKCLLVITDGIGYSTQDAYNAFAHAAKPTYDALFATVPYGMVATYGLAVGLPEGQMGNSEVGHMTIGAGRVMYQDLVKISKAVAEGTLASMPAIADVAASTSRVHLVGLVSDGGVHSHIDHLIGLIGLFAAAGKEIWIHLITDGRDTAPTSGVAFVRKVEEAAAGKARIASVGGRFFAMDRDKRWERVAKGYAAMTGTAPRIATGASAYMEAQYAAGITDEFIEPVTLEDFGEIREGDGVVFYNFRSDRMRQLVDVFGNEGFDGFARPFVPTRIVTMTEYAKEFPYPVVFSKDEPRDVLAEAVSKAGLRQFHTAETEKYAHVTFFLNGGREDPFPGETRVLIPSPKVKTYDEKPQMSADEVGDAVLVAMDEGYDLVVVNFANGDMVGHTGNYEAALKAVETVDANVGRLIAKAREKGYAMVLTSDHGNCEEMKNLESGEMLTNHTVGDVWCFVMADGVTAVADGALNNIAPTVLTLMGLDIPQAMDDALI